jgi:hypothetical protein
MDDKKIDGVIDTKIIEGLKRVLGEDRNNIVLIAVSRNVAERYLALLESVKTDPTDEGPEK